MSYEFFLPELGEGIESGTVIALSYKPGDKILEDDSILELETDKAAMGIPSPVEGTLVKYQVNEGDDIKIGDLIAIFETDSSSVSDDTVVSDIDSVDTKKDTETIELPIKTEEPKKTQATAQNLDFTLPELGEGIKGGAVLSVFASVGETLSEGDPILELETDKAAMTVPAPADGTVISINVEEGQELVIGDLVAVISSANQETKTLDEIASADTIIVPIASSKVETEVIEKTISAPTTGSSSVASTPNKIVRAGPATRKFAREMGIDLGLVKGSKRNGRIDVLDIKSYVKEVISGKTANPSSAGGLARPALTLPDFSKFGPIKTEKMSKIRKIVSQRMGDFWNTIPHVYQFQDIDITDLSRIQKAYKEEFKEKGSTASPTNFFIKTLAICMKEFPKFNSSVDEVNQEIILKDYFNVGVAVDTPAGLVVPVLKDVDQMSIFDIGKNLKDIAKRARDRNITPAEMTGGSITLSNLGGIGGTHFTPIVNWPEVAILGVARAEKKPVYIDGAFVPRDIVTVCLSYDHRVIDGADAARFVVRFKSIMENFERTLLGV